MGAIKILDGETVSSEGFFDFKELYTHIHEWLEWKKFGVSEKKYKTKVKGAEKELEIKWEATKKVDEYTEFKIELGWKITGMTDEEVVEDGKKKKMNKGTVEVKIDASYKTDYDEYWNRSPMLKFMQQFYEKYMYKGTIKKHEDDLWAVGWDLFNEIKSYLHLYKF